jgi:hypothetical protein
LLALSGSKLDSVGCFRFHGRPFVVRAAASYPGLDAINGGNRTYA